MPAPCLPITTRSAPRSRSCRAGLNVRQTEALAHHRPARLLPKDTETIAVERQLAAHLGLKVSILHDGQGGSLRIGYSDLDQLDGLIRVLLQK